MTKFKPQLGRHGLELEARDVPAALDPTFGTGGTAIFGTANTSSPISYGMTTDGSILTVAKDGNSQGSFGVRRLTPAGAPDTGYGTAGTATVTTDLRLASFSRLLPTGRADADGSLILGGVAGVLRDGDSFSAPYVVKVTPQGALDAAYGNKGQAVFPAIDGVTGQQLSTSLNGVRTDAAQFEFSSATAKFTAEAGGTVVGVLAGEASALSGKPAPAFVVRIGKDGKLDPTFGKGGLVPIDSGYFLSVSRSTVAGSDVLPASGGGYYLTGSTAAGFVVQKLTAAGDVDLAFGRNGVAVLDTPFAIPDVSATVAQNSAKPNGGVFGDFELSGNDAIIVGGFLNVKGSPGDPDLLRSTFTRLDLNAATPALPAAPKPIDVSATNVIADQSGGSEVGEVRLDLTGDGKADIVRFERAKAGGSASRFGVVDGATGAELVNNFRPFEDAYDGGLVVTGGDFDGDGRDELVVAPDVGGAARVQIFKLVNGRLVLSDNFFAIEDPAFRGGARIAAADLNGDGKADLVVSAGPGGGPRVAIYDGADLSAGKARPRKLQADFFAYAAESDQQLRNGVSVAVNDINGDGVADLFLGAGVGGAPRLTVLDGKKLGTQGIDAARRAPLDDKFLGGDSTSREGVQFLPKLKAGAAGNDVVVINRGDGSQFLNGKSDPLR